MATWLFGFILGYLLSWFIASPGNTYILSLLALLLTVLPTGWSGICLFLNILLDKFPCHKKSALPSHLKRISPILCQSLQTIWAPLNRWINLAPTLYFTKRQLVWGLTLLCGLLWGGLNSGLLPRSTILGVRIVKVTPLRSGIQQLLVKKGDFVFYVRGKGGVGDLGNIDCRDKYHSSISILQNRCTFKKGIHQKERGAHTPLFRRWFFKLRHSIWGRIKRYREPVRGWLQCLILGSRKDFPFQTRKAFKVSGVYHLLVISGLHISMLGLIIGIGLSSPFYLAYTMRWQSPQAWAHIAGAIPPLSGFLLLVFTGIIGFSSASQRALIIYLVFVLAPILIGNPPLIQKIKFAILIQTIAFPLGFVSISNFLSWGAYILVLAYTINLPATILGKIRALIATQFKLLILSFALIGEISLVGIFVNIVITPLFPLVFFAALLGVFFYDVDEISSKLALFQEYFLLSINLISDFCNKHLPGQHLKIIGAFGANWVRMGLIGLSGVLLCKDLNKITSKGINSVGE